MRVKKLKSHELAPHIAVWFRNLAPNDLQPVEYTIRHVTSLLQSVEPTTLDLSNPDNGIPYALSLQKANQQTNIQNAASLLHLCLHATERGYTTENDRVFIPLQLAGLSEFLSDYRLKIAKLPRTKKHDSLDNGLDRAIKNNPLGEWTEHAAWLEGEDIVAEWGLNNLTFLDGESEKTITTGRFRNRITAARKRSRNIYHY